MKMLLQEINSSREDLSSGDSPSRSLVFDAAGDGAFELHASRPGIQYGFRMAAQQRHFTWTVPE